jgi:hypothetical protein
MRKLALLLVLMLICLPAVLAIKGTIWTPKQVLRLNQTGQYEGTVEIKNDNPVPIITFLQGFEGPLVPYQDGLLYPINNSPKKEILTNETYKFGFMAMVGEPIDTTYNLLAVVVDANNSKSSIGLIAKVTIVSNFEGANLTEKQRNCLQTTIDTIPKEGTKPQDFLIQYQKCANQPDITPKSGLVLLVIVLLAVTVLIVLYAVMAARSGGKNENS